MSEPLTFPHCTAFSVPAVADIIPIASDGDVNVTFAHEVTLHGWHKMKASLGMDRAVDTVRQPVGHFVTATAVPDGGTGFAWNGA